MSLIEHAHAPETAPRGVKRVYLHTVTGETMDALPGGPLPDREPGHWYAPARFAVTESSLVHPFEATCPHHSGITISVLTDEQFEEGRINVILPENPDVGQPRFCVIDLDDGHRVIPGIERFDFSRLAYQGEIDLRSMGRVVVS